MAKKTSQQTIPHVTVGAMKTLTVGGAQRLRLQTAMKASGVSDQGARQFANGQIVMSRADRFRLVELMNSAVGHHEITGALVKIN